MMLIDNSTPSRLQVRKEEAEESAGVLSRLHTATASICCAKFWLPF